MKNLYSRIRNFTLLKKKEVVVTFSTFSKKEWVIFSVFGVVFLVSALFLLNTLNRSFMVNVPRNGGTVNEGIVGSPRFINPILAFSDADRDLVSLIYSGLMRKNSDGVLIPDLAEKYEVSDDGLVYTFTIKSNATFHSGESVTADDVIFTLNEARNPLLHIANGEYWGGVTMEKIDELTIKFTLRKSDAYFLENTTLGVMPESLWNKSPIELNDHNTNPVGSGPFKVKKMVQGPQGIVTSYELVPFKKFTLGRPYLDRINLYFYANETDLMNALLSNDVDQISGIAPEGANVLKDKNYRIESYELPRIFGLFFNQNENSIFIDKNVIKAINMAIDKERIVREALLGYGATIWGPIPPALKKNIDDPEKTKTSHEKDIEEAVALLSKDGWKKNEDGLLEKIVGVGKNKSTTKLSFSISTSNSSDLAKAAKIIKENLEQLGAQVEIKTFEIGDLNQSVIRPRKYESLLFGEIINQQSDLFAFWHSSERKDPGLNVAIYTNAKVDKILEDALGILDEDKREEKYSQFESEIKKDMPAVFLYSPNFIYVTKKNLNEPLGKAIIFPRDRFLSSYLWYSETDNVWKIFAQQ